TWLNWWTCVCLPAFGFAFVAWGAVTTLYVSLAVAFLTTLVLIGARGEHQKPEEPARTKALRIVRIDAFAVVALFSVMMLAQVSGAFWLLLLGLMIATTPPAAAWWRRVGAFFAKQSEEAPEEAQESPAAPPAAEVHLRELTDIELCYKLLHSIWIIDIERSPADRTTIDTQIHRLHYEIIT